MFYVPVGLWVSISLQLISSYKQVCLQTSIYNFSYICIQQVSFHSWATSSIVVFYLVLEYKFILGTSQSTKTSAHMVLWMYVVL